MNARPAAIEILAIRHLDGTTSVKAFVDIRLGGVTIKGTKIIQQEGQRAWLAMPAIQTKRAWLNTVELTKELRERVTPIAIEAWEQSLKHAAPPPAAPTTGRDRVAELAAQFDARGPDEPGF